MIFISEIGMNYNGNFSLIYELIKQSKISGASICKFQLGWRDKPGEINQLDLEKVNQIINWCNYFVRVFEGLSADGGKGGVVPVGDFPALCSSGPQSTRGVVRCACRRCLKCDGTAWSAGTVQVGAAR